MKIKTWIKYQTPCLPPRCRRPRHEEREEYVDATLREVDGAKPAPAYEDKSYGGKGKIYRYGGRLWAKAKLGPTEKRMNEEGKAKIETPLDWLVYGNANYSRYFAKACIDADLSRESVMRRLKADMAKLILVDGELYERTAKPEYLILTFGCGNNDGTGLFVEYPARRDCGWRFPATKGAEAVTKANEIAARRGDTNYVGKFTADIIIY